MRSECDRIQRKNEDGQRNASTALKEEYETARQEVTRRHEVCYGRREVKRRVKEDR